MSMLTAGDSKGHHGFSRDYSFLLARSSSDSGSCTGAGCSSNGRAFASANEATDHGSSGGTSTDFDDIALGMALAFTVITGTGNRLAVDGRQTQRELAGCMKASAGLGVSDFASNVTTRSGYRLTVDDDVSGQGSVPGLAGVRRTGADGRTEANGYVCPCGNAGRADQQSRAEQQHCKHDKSLNSHVLFVPPTTCGNNITLGNIRAPEPGLWRTSKPMSLL